MTTAEAGGEAPDPDAADGQGYPARTQLALPLAPTGELPPQDDGTGVTMDTSALVPGATISQYELIRPLGRGGMGHVFLARDTRLGRLAALKFLIEHSGARARWFISEARATAQFNHENVVVIYEVGEHGGFPFMALEYVRGQTLQEWLDERKMRQAAWTERQANASAPTGLRMPTGIVVPPQRAAELMIPVVRALVRAHALGIVHRDLKLANIMLAEDGTVKVLDFGVAMILGDAHAAGDGKSGTRPGGTHPGSQPPTGLATPTDIDGRIGTMMYMSPEQWGADDVDHRTDIWAVGLMLHELALGCHPLIPASGDVMVAAVLPSVADLDQPMPSVRERCPALGKLGLLIDRCLIKHKADRIGSARALLAELEALARPRRGAHGRDDDDSPYPGLAAFQELDADRFFGRERVVQQVLARLDVQPLVALVGPSGAGKSSFVRAGLIPALKHSGGAWEAFVIRPGPRPLAALAELLAQHRWQQGRPPRRKDTAEAGERAAIRDRLRAEPGFLGVQLRARARRKIARILLFVDQLEELYTLAPADEREAFFACLAGVADDVDSAVRVVVTMRSDLLDRVAESHAAMTGLSRGLLLLTPLDRDGLREALVRPLEAAEYRFEDPALVDEMLDALAPTRGALPLLQFTAAKLWEHRDRQRRVLTMDSYRALGGVAGTLASHADAVLGAMPAAERRLARAALLRLVTPERTRALVTIAELRELAGSAAEDMDRVLARLIDARLLVVETGGAPGGDGDGDAKGDGNRDGNGEGVVELVHESLIERWPLLDQWLRESEADAAFLGRLRSAASEWQRGGRDEDLVWRGHTAQEAQRWYARHRKEPRRRISAREADYLAEVVRLGQRAQRQRRLMLGGLIAALVTVAVVVSYLAVLATSEAARAERQAARAEAEAARARDQAIQREREAVRARNATRQAAAEAQRNDPTTALALLREVEPGPLPPSWSALARWALDAGVARAVVAHPDMVFAVAFSPDGTRVASASWDKTIRVWRTRGDGTYVGEPLILRGHEAPVVAVAFSPDGTRIASASHDKTVRVWDVDGRGKPLVLRGHEAWVTSVAFSPDGARIASASWDETVRVWDVGGVPPGAPGGVGDPLVLRGHEADVFSVAFSPDGTRIASASRDETVRVWEVDGRGKPLVLRGHGERVFAVAFSPDGQRLASASRDKTVRVWRVRDERGRLPGRLREPVVLRGHEADILSVAFSPDGQRLASASWDKTVRVWRVGGAPGAGDGAEGEPLVLRGHGDAVTSVAFSPDGQHLASASSDHTMRVWRARADDPLVLRGHERAVDAVAFSPDGARIASASHDKTVRVWRADGRGAPLVLRGHEDSVAQIAFSPDGQRIASSSYDKTVRVWNVDGAPFGTQGGVGEPLVLRGHQRTVIMVAFSPDGQRLASVSHDKTVRVWNIGGGAGAPGGVGDPLVLRGHEDTVWFAAFSPDGTRLASASHDRTVRVWNIGGGAGAPASVGDPLVLRGHEDGVSLVAFSPDGTRLASASHDKTVRVWNVDGAPPGAPGGVGDPRVLRGHDAWVTSLAFSPDGTRLASASHDKTVRVWPIDETAPAAEGGASDVVGAPAILRGHEDGIAAIAFAPDGLRIASASQDKTVRVWNIDETAEDAGDVVILRGHEDGVVAVAFSPDGASIASASHDKTVRVWRDLAPLVPMGRRLWTATSYCLSTELRQSLLGVPADMARQAQARCLRRVTAAR